MNRKNYLILLSIICFSFLFATFLMIKVISQRKRILYSQTIAIKPVSSTVSAEGVIRSENEATINFQTGGKLVYLPFKEGDNIEQGQTIAQLDTYDLQRQLTAALNNYRVTRNSFDQTKDNSANGILQGQQKYAVNFQNANPVSGDLQYTVVSDIVKRVLDQNQANLDNSVINVELANYALQLATLTSPISGVITHEDISVPNVNITPLTTFSIADPTSPVFRANVSENDIDFVSVGASVSIQITGLKKTLAGTVSKIYPKKITLPSGQEVYQVDITSDDLKSVGKLEQSGSVLITSNSTQGIMLIPSWAVLSHSFVWAEENGKPVLKHITEGKTHGDFVEILGGLRSEDKIIVSPKSVAAESYDLL